MLDEYSVLSDGTIRDDQGWLNTDGSFTNVIRDDSGLLNMLGVTAYDIVPFAGRPVLNEDSWNAYRVAGYSPQSWVRSTLSFPFLTSRVVIVGINGKSDPNPPITIIDQPVGQSVLQGDSTSFGCFAQPFEYLSYQWLFKGKDIPGATGWELEIPSVSKANTGIYQLALSTGGKPVLSNRALLRMVFPVVLKTQPK